jgi:hypothetical protein
MKIKMTEKTRYHDVTLIAEKSHDRWAFDVEVSRGGTHAWSDYSRDDPEEVAAAIVELARQVTTLIEAKQE